MQENIDFRRLLKMKIKYELEANDFASEEEIKQFIEEAKKTPDIAMQEFTNLVKGSVEKLQPAISDISARFVKELGSLIAGVATEAAIEIIATNIKKVLENPS